VFVTRSRFARLSVGEMRGHIMDCGGKRSTTPLSSAREISVIRWCVARAKAPSPLRFAGAVQDASVNCGSFIRPEAILDFGRCCGPQSRAPSKEKYFEGRAL
jgi:hypothetical protein